MTTYPVYRATLGGSADFMAHSTMLVAARNKREAKRLLVARQNWRSNTLGKMVRYSPEFRTYVLDDNAIERVTSIRATKLGWMMSNNNF